MKNWNKILAAVREVFWVGILICMVAKEVLGEHKAIQIVLILCCIGSIACSVDYFLNRR